MYGRQNKNKYNQDETSAKSLSNYSMQDLLKGKNLELVAAALLLTGKLKVDSVQVFRDSPAVNVNLVGKFLTTKQDKSNALADFLDNNGNMTLDQVFDAFQKRMQKGGK